MGAYLVWTTKQGQTGTLRFDAVTSERHQISSAVTEHPVEQGANISDHARAELDVLDLEVFVSNAPLDADDKSKSKEEGENKLGEVKALALDVKPYKSPMGYLALLGEIEALVSKQKQYSATVLQFGLTQNFVSQTYAILRGLRDNAQLIKVVSPMWDYENMLLTRVEMPRTPQEGDGARFTLSFKQIRLVETKRTAEPVPTEKRGAKAKQKGAKGAQTQPAASRQSNARKAAGALDSFLGGALGLGG